MSTSTNLVSTMITREKKGYLQCASGALASIHASSARAKPYVVLSESAGEVDQ